MSSTQLILIAVAVAVIAFFFWRSKREEKRIRRPNLNRVEHDVLETPPARTEPVMNADAPASVSGENSAEMADFESKAKALARELDSDMPSDEPPIYEGFAEQKKREAAEAVAKAEVSAQVAAGLKTPPVDQGIEWVLDITPFEGKAFSIGGVATLCEELRSLELSLPWELWAKSRNDDLYYPARYLPGEAVHLVASLVLANRAGSLDEVNASRFLQVLEQTAAQQDVDVRTSMDLNAAVAMAGKIKRFIGYYDKMIDLMIVKPANSGEFTLEAVDAVAVSSGFVSASGRWEKRYDPMSKEPEMTLSFVGNGALRLSLDLPLSNPARGDLTAFLQVANHIANHLGALWVDCQGKPIGAGGALLLEENVFKDAASMEAGTVRSGSVRARLLFSRSA